MKKIFVLDTNVLLNDPMSMFQFEDNDVIIPITCIEEIDKFKRDQNGRGRNARAVSRYLDRLRKTTGTSLSDGVTLDNGGFLKVELGWEAIQNYPYGNGGLENDDKILAVALEVKKNSPNITVVLLTRDTNLRIRGDAMGLNAEDYETDHTDIESLYSGLREITVPGDLIDSLYQDKVIDTPELDDLYSNQYLLLRNQAEPSRTGLARLSADREKIHVCCTGKQTCWGITPRNLEQKIAVDLLLDDRISLVTLVGSAGTGKTLLSLATGLSKAVDDQKYRKLLVSRPIFPMGRDLGYLPGEIKDKLKPWMQPIFDNLEMLFHKDEPGNPGKYRNTAIDLIEQNMLEIEALTYIRGRSIPGQFFIVDEAQNLTPHEIKTIVSRAGDGTKIILTGDPYQIDNPYLDSESTGLTRVVEKFKDSPLAGHITLTKGERSPLAQAAAERL